MDYGVKSEVGKIESILIKNSRDAFVSQEEIDRQWEELNYYDRPDYEKAATEYDQFAGLLQRAGIALHFLPQNKGTGLDSIYPRDAVVITPAGAILCRMGKTARKDEPEVVADYLREINIPILGAIEGEGKLEGGDLIWLDSKTLAVGQGYRTNEEGIKQLRNLTSDFVENIVAVPLPHWEGPEDVFHLMSIISPIDHDLAVVYSRLMPVPFRQWLMSRGMKLIEVPDEEFDSMACNILAIAPRKCIMLSGNPRTRALLDDEGVEVLEYSGQEISRKGAGGPTCLTRPLFRSE